MRRRTTIILLLVMILFTACNTEQPQTGVNYTANPVSTQNLDESALTGETQSSESELSEYDCLNGEISPIGQSIADSYDTVTYEQIITWFCSGAEYEDILVALETETLTETSAKEMLQMLADGLTWEDIWFLVGVE